MNTKKPVRKKVKGFAFLGATGVVLGVFSFKIKSCIHIPNGNPKSKTVPCEITYTLK